MNRIVKGGTLVGPLSTFEADLAIADGRITQIGLDLAAGDSEVIDAHGLLVLPGLVDLHAHFGEPGSDGIEAGTRAAAWGGVTTSIGFARQRPGGTLSAAIEDAVARFTTESYCDFSFHVSPCEWNEATRREVRERIEAGFPSFKAQTGPGCIEGWGALTEAALLELLEETAKFGGSVLLLPGHAGLTTAFRDRLVRSGQYDLAKLEAAHPPAVEADAIRRAASLAEQVAGNLLIGPVSSGEAAEAVLWGRARGVNVAAETTLFHLVQPPEGTDALQRATWPPLRGAEETEALWNALGTGALEAITSGHRATSLERRRASLEDPSAIPGGLPAIELTLALLLSEGVRRSRLTLPRLCQLLSTHPAMLAGLFPRKGILQVGSDADLVLVDPTLEWTVAAGRLHMAVDHSPYEGVSVYGAPVATLLRGEVIRRGDEFFGKPGQGQRLPRKPMEEVF